MTRHRYARVAAWYLVLIALLELPAHGASAEPTKNGAKRQAGGRRKRTQLDSDRAAFSFLCSFYFPGWIGLCVLVAGCTRMGDRGNSVDELLRMQGTWRVERLEQDGETAADAHLLKTVIIKDDRITFRYGGLRSKKPADLIDRFKLDVSKTPKRIETRSSQDRRLQVGIYKLEADTLTFCWNRKDVSNPPTDFTCPKGSNWRLLVLKRMPSKLR